jgi:hypothetical protein
MIFWVKGREREVERNAGHLCKKKDFVQAHLSSVEGEKEEGRRRRSKSFFSRRRRREPDVSI